ncbi:hypothetical protein E0Z10_g10697 [Xylaria hypoxylon]|uniref:TeaA receptor TeaR n=1 Tax=Xylaria hypoxylon TaxID=37992 RepID=A0A4Z0Y1G2_9PEZI|nr:hypothetical protein E0Z10_g10697 [Xylaria hypoxylon]
MAALSAASGPASFRHQNDPQDEYAEWNHASNSHNETSMNHSFADYDGVGSSQSAPVSQNGATEGYFPLRESRSNSRATAPPQTKRAKDGTILTYDDENSQWIHRDKLAKIESREMQEAGLTLPKPRTQNQVVANWDLRLPEEIAEDPGEYWVSNESGRGTRIPVAKVSPAPIPSDYIDRNTPVQRKPSFSVFDEETSIVYPKTRSRSNSTANAFEDASKAQSGKRSVTDGSPKKTTTTAPRKTSAPTKSTTQGRPKTRSGPTGRSSSTTRPSTRSGELSPRAPEGEPPWMISAYQPDPRLPPDQQLLPTVAKRLQQEKWEQEGAFGSVYDKEFRPLNKDTFAKPLELEKLPDSEEAQDEWPLKPDARVPTPSRPGTSSYSTMPKIQDAPAMKPLSSPRPMQQLHTQAQTQTSAAVKVSDPMEQSEEQDEKAGCGCCTVM